MIHIESGSLNGIIADLISSKMEHGRNLHESPVVLLRIRVGRAALLESRRSATPPERTATSRENTFDAKTMRRFENAKLDPATKTMPKFENAQFGPGGGNSVGAWERSLLCVFWTTLISSNSVAQYDPTDHTHLVLEYAAHGELSDFLISRCHREPVLATSFVREIIYAVEYLYSHGICHCDLKPESVFLGEFNHVNVADFGFARWSIADTSRRLPFDDPLIRNPLPKVKAGRYTMPDQFPPPIAELITKMLQMDFLKRARCARSDRHPEVDRVRNRAGDLERARLRPPHEREGVPRDVLRENKGR
jgi:hypothetical protein